MSIPPEARSLHPLPSPLAAVWPRVLLSTCSAATHPLMGFIKNCLCMSELWARAGKAVQEEGPVLGQPGERMRHRQAELGLSQVACQLQGHLLLVSKSEGRCGWQSTRENAGRKRAPQWAGDGGDDWRLGWGGSGCLSHHPALFPSHCLAVLTRNGLKRKGRGAGFCAPESVHSCLLPQADWAACAEGPGCGSGKICERNLFLSLC